MDFECCADDPHEVSVSDSAAEYRSRNSADSEDEPRVSTSYNCDYKHVTPLFKAIESEDWNGVLLFLSSGKWSNSALSSAYMHLHGPSPRHQACTWVTSCDKDGQVQWSQLPIHAAISYFAPLPIIQKLVKLYPEGVRSADDTGNLPLHLAFGFGASDSVISYLLEEYPQGLKKRGLQGRLPVDCAELGTNKLRGDIIKACQNQFMENVVRDWDEDWKNMFVEVAKDSGLEDYITVENMTLKEVFKHFASKQKELEMQRSPDPPIVSRTGWGGSSVVSRVSSRQNRKKAKKLERTEQIEPKKFRLLRRLKPKQRALIDS